jgi:hypothetical protein
MPATAIDVPMLNGKLAKLKDKPGADADMIVIPPSIPIVGGQPVSRLLPGGTGNCAPHTAKDIGPGSQPGWYFYLNFTAHRVTWTGP